MNPMRASGNPQEKINAKAHHVFQAQTIGPHVLGTLPIAASDAPSPGLTGLFLIATGAGQGSPAHSRLQTGGEL